MTTETRRYVTLAALALLACGAWTCGPSDACGEGKHEEQDCHMIGGDPVCGSICVPDDPQ